MHSRWVSNEIQLSDREGSVLCLPRVAQPRSWVEGEGVAPRVPAPLPRVGAAEEEEQEAQMAEQAWIVREGAVVLAGLAVQLMIGRVAEGEEREEVVGPEMEWEEQVGRWALIEKEVGVPGTVEEALGELVGL